MKFLVKRAAVWLLIGIGLAGCKEDEQLNPTNEKSNKFQLLADIPKESPADSIFYAIVSIRDQSNQEVVRDRKLMLRGSNKSISEEIELPSGDYTITKFVVIKADDISIYASPVRNSDKAALVQKPLTISFSLPNPNVLQIPLDVLKIQVNDDDELFGYPNNTFKRESTQPAGFFKIKLQAHIAVGNINYDSIPAVFKILSRDAAGQLHEKDTLLAAGTNEIMLPDSHVEFQFKMTKWGISDETTLSRAEINPGTVYILGGTKPAKMLRREEKFTFAEGAYRPSSKALYSYHSDNKLSRAMFYQKLPQHSDLQMVMSRTYLYSDNNVTRIIRQDKDNIETGHTLFTYNPQKSRVVSMYEKSYDQETNATIKYTFLPGNSIITVNYLFDNGKSLEYKMKIVRGNKVEDGASASSAGESGSYAYDSNINPYAHMSMPDLYLSNFSKNNLIHRQKAFSGSIPSSEPYKYDYVYDEEGYPKELVTSYMNYLTGEHLFKIKTVYYY